MLYRCDTWTLLTESERRTQAFENPDLQLSSGVDMSGWVMWPTPTFCQRKSFKVNSTVARGRTDLQTEVDRSSCVGPDDHSPRQTWVALIVICLVYVLTPATSPSPGTNQRIYGTTKKEEADRTAIKKTDQIERAKAVEGNSEPEKRIEKGNRSRSRHKWLVLT